MYKAQSRIKTPSLFWDLASMLDIHHELYILAGLIDWHMFEQSFAPLFSATNGRPAKPVRLMVGLLMLKHIRNVSDEQVVDQFRENAITSGSVAWIVFARPLPVLPVSWFISVIVSARRAQS